MWKVKQIKANAPFVILSCKNRRADVLRFVGSQRFVLQVKLTSVSGDHNVLRD